MYEKRIMFWSLSKELLFQSDIIDNIYGLKSCKQ